MIIHHLEDIKRKKDDRMFKLIEEILKQTMKNIFHRFKLSFYIIYYKKSLKHLY